jgi:hypothetical protein
MTTESQRCNCFIRDEENAIPKRSGPEALGSNPTAGLTLLWARNPFRGSSIYWEVSQEEAGPTCEILFVKQRLETQRRQKNLRLYATDLRFIESLFMCT